MCVGGRCASESSYVHVLNRSKLCVCGRRNRDANATTHCVILQGRAGQEEGAAVAELLPEGPAQPRVRVLEAVRLRARTCVSFGVRGWLVCNVVFSFLGGNNVTSSTTSTSQDSCASSRASCARIISGVVMSTWLFSRGGGYVINERARRPVTTRYNAHSPHQHKQPKQPNNQNVPGIWAAPPLARRACPLPASCPPGVRLRRSPAPRPRTTTRRRGTRRGPPRCRGRRCYWVVVFVGYRWAWKTAMGKRGKGKGCSHTQTNTHTHSYTWHHDVRVEVRPGAELAIPVLQRRERGHHEVGAGGALLLLHSPPEERWWISTGPTCGFHAIQPIICKAQAPERTTRACTKATVCTVLPRPICCCMQGWVG